MVLLHSLQRRKILFRLHLTPYRGGGPPRLPEWLSAGRQADGRQGIQACPAGRPYGMPESIVMGCVIRNLSIPARTALRVTGRTHPVDAVFQGPPDAASLPAARQGDHSIVLN